jgi:WD40 repeat protein
MNEKYIVSGGEKEVKMWDLRSGQIVKKIKGHKSTNFNFRFLKFTFEVFNALVFI